MTFTEYFLGIENWSQSVFLTSPGECFFSTKWFCYAFLQTGKWRRLGEAKLSAQCCVVIA